MHTVLAARQQHVVGMHMCTTQNAMRARLLVAKSSTGGAAGRPCSPLKAPVHAEQQQLAALPRHHSQQGAMLLPRRALLGITASMMACAWASMLQAGTVHAAPEPEAAQRVASQIEQDFVQGQYYITGALTPDIYEPDCRFTDPTTDVHGFKLYTQAVALLFDPAISKADLISIKVLDPTTIRVRWRLEGALRLGGLKFKPYTGTTLYHLSPTSGRITWHEETWDISALDAFGSTLVPGLGAPPAPPVEQLRAAEAAA